MSTCADKEIDDIPLSRRDTLRRAVMLCESFGRNLAYYRAGQEEPYLALLRSKSKHQSLFRQFNSNAIDIATLDWCKLMTDNSKSQYFWKKLLTDDDIFSEKLQALPEFNSIPYSDFVNQMKHFRDKFVAHLDGLRVMNIPTFDAAYASIRLYHAEIVEVEASAGDLIGLCSTSEDFTNSYEQCRRDTKTFLEPFLSQ